jgi:hypothetical protein
MFEIRKMKSQMMGLVIWTLVIGSSFQGAYDGG